jgi:soluble lytic murein transglycosylase-like protein
MGDPGAAMRWMRRAAAEPRTLHGLIARRALGLNTGIVPSGELLSQADVDAVAGTPGGLRAFAWLEVGQPRRAAEELRGVWAQVKDTPALRRSVLLVAARSGLHALAGELAGLEAEADGVFPAAPARVPTLQPAHGFHIDPALVYALTRTESNFDPNAISSAGAHGLMQIMPVTAKFVAGDPGLSKEALHDPAMNLALGQRYVAWLADQDPVNGNLLLLLASYNNGLGGLSRWLGQVRDGGDPLMFLEAIPVPETRAFVRDVLTHTWLYAAQLRLPAPSLDAMVEGRFPHFTASPAQGKLLVTAHGD